MKIIFILLTIWDGRITPVAHYENYTQCMTQRARVEEEIRAVGTALCIPANR